MGTLCITGAGWKDVSLIAAILQKCGMALPEASQRSSSRDIGFWHEQVTTGASEASTGFGPITRFGRFWEQLAGDIFEANVETPLWGWADTRSVRLLDFWHDFEPRIYFLLVCVSPRHLLARAMEEDPLPVSVSELLAKWQAYHQEMLRFYHRHPSRTLLLDARECVAHPAALIELCATRWNLPFVMEETIQFDNPINLFSEYLAAQFCKDYPEIISLSDELDATVINLTEKLLPYEEKSVSSDTIIGKYRSLLESFNNIQRVETLQQNVSSLVKDVEAQKIIIVNKERQIDKMQDSLNEMTCRVKDVKDVHTDLEKCENKLDDANKENDLLLMQLHKVQEELEYYFFQYKDMQEKFNNVDGRLQRMINRHPWHCDYESVSIDVSPDNLMQKLTIRFNDFYCIDRHLPELEIDIVLEHGIAGFRFRRKADGVSPLLRWPSGAEGKENVAIIPVVKDENDQLRYEVFLDLSTTDWRFVQSVALISLEILQFSKEDGHFKEGQKKNFTTGLDKFLSIINTFPPVFRYDRVELKNQQVNPSYEHLWLRLENVALDGKLWVDFEFRVSCANVNSNSFGAQPKLEFPEKFGEAPLESWFDESSDDFGAKLELRFALPHDMDMYIWNRMSNNDKNFISKLISRLPSILHGLRDRGVPMNRSWDDWIKMTLDMQCILRINTAVTE